MSAEPAFLDSNILIYALDPTFDCHALCRTLLGRAHERDAGLCLAPQVLAEFFAVVTDGRRVPKPRSSQETADLIDQLLLMPGMTVLPTPSNQTSI